MLKNISFKFRIYPNKIQKEKINNNIQCAKFVYNKLLDSRIYNYGKYLQYKKRCKKIGIKANPKSFYSFCKLTTVTQIKKSYEFLKEADSLALCAEYNNLKNAFNNFFLNLRSFPKHKSRKDKNSYVTSFVNNNIRIENNKIRLPKIGFVKIKLHRNIPGNYKIKRVVVIDDKCTGYYVSIVFECYENVEKHKLEKTVGLDFKIGDIFVSSDNEIPKYIMPYRRALDRLKKLQKTQKKKKKFSKNWYKILKKIQRLHKKISNKRRNFLHKLSRKLCSKYDLICIENLSMIDISQKLSSGNNTYDTSYYKFTCMLKYKLESLGKKIIKIDKWYPSSKICSNCGVQKNIISLDERVYECKKCGLVLNRDLNAAINIKNEGLRLLN